MEFWPLSKRPTTGTESETQIKIESGEPKMANPNLENGLRLSVSERNTCTKDKTGIPLEDIDPFYKEGTFVVIGKGTHVVHRYSKDSCLDIGNSLRRFAVGLITHWGFVVFMVAVILANAKALTIETTSIFTTLEIISLVAFVVELILKLMAQGLFTGQFSYLRIGWNWLDLAIIFFSVLSLINDKGMFAFLVFLRNFKLIPLVPGLLSAFKFLKETTKKLVDHILYSLIPLFMLTVFGLLAYMGVLRQKCISIMPPSESSQNYTKEALERHRQNESNWYQEDGEYRLCGFSNIGNTCPQNYSCAHGFGPNTGFTNFDSFFWSLRSVLRLIFQDQPHLFYYQMVTAVGEWYFLYTSAVFLFGTFTLGCFAYAIIGKELTNYISNQGPVKVKEEIETPKPCPEEQSGSGIRACRQKCKALVEHRIFEFFVTTIIVLDIICLFTHHFEAPNLHFHITLGIAGAAVIVYTAEFILKLIALGPLAYFSKFWNCFDFLVIILAAVYFTLYGITFINDEEVTHSVAFYSIRALKLAPRWPSLGFIFTVILRTVKSFTGMVLIFGVFIFNFALAGNLLFSRENLETENILRWNFNTMYKSLAYAARILVGEWVEFIWDFFRVGDEDWQGLLFSLVGILLGNLIIMTLALGILFTARDVVEADLQSASKRKLTALQLMCLPCTWMSTKVSGYCKLKNTMIYRTSDEAAAAGQTNLGETTIPEQEGSAGTCRTRIQKFLQLKPVRICSIVMIIIGSLVLPDAQLVVGIYYFDIFFTIYFIVEIILKFIGFGFKKCLKDKGLIFDIIIILEMILNFIMYHDFGAVLTCTTGACGYFYLRNLRPLMLIYRLERLKVIAQGIWYELYALNSYIWAGFYLWLVFAIVGVHTFGGRFYRCVDTVGNAAVSVETKQDCLNNNLTWKGSDYNFNDISNGLLSLAHVGGLDDWTGITTNAVDAIDVDAQPIRDKYQRSIIYFVFFYVVGIFFLFNTLFGIVLSTFPKGKSFKIFRTSEQIKYYESQADGKSRNCGRTIPKPENKILGDIYDLVSSRVFELVIIGLILIDGVFFACEKYNESQMAQDVHSYAHGLILFIFLLELILKLLAWRQHYFKSCLNILDFVVVITSLLGLLLMDLMEAYLVSPVLLRFMRTIRLVRLFQLLETEKKYTRRSRILSLLKAFRVSIPVLLNFFLFYAIFFFCFNVIGFELFIGLKIDDGENFKTLGNTLSTLVEITTFAGWSNVLQNIENGQAGCETDLCKLATYKHGLIFVFSFLALNFLVVVNMYFVLVLEIINQFNVFEKAAVEENNGEELQDIKKTDDIEIGEIPKRGLEGEEEVQVILSE